MLKAILEILSALLRAMEKSKAKKEQQRAQDEADTISTNPTEWFTDHFGVRDATDKTDSSKANPDNSHRS